MKDKFSFYVAILIIIMHVSTFFKFIYFQETQLFELKKVVAFRSNNYSILLIKIIKIRRPEVKKFLYTGL